MKTLFDLIVIARGIALLPVLLCWIGLIGYGVMKLSRLLRGRPFADLQPYELAEHAERRRLRRLGLDAKEIESRVAIMNNRSYLNALEQS